MSRRLKIGFGVVFFALMLFYLGFRAWVGFVIPEQVSRRGWSAVLSDGKARVSVIGEKSPAQGLLEVGDEVLELRSPRSSEMPVVSDEFWRVPRDTPYTLVVRRGEVTREIELRTVSLIQVGPRGIFLLIILLTFLLFLVTGLAVFALKPGDKQAWLLALMLGSLVALVHVNSQVRLSGPVLIPIFLAQVLATLFLPVFFHFFLVFPDRSPFLRRFPKLESRLYWPYFLLILPVFVIDRWALRFDFGFEALRSMFSTWINLVITISVSLYMIGGLLSLIVNYRQADLVDRRKLRVIMIGSGAGFFNILMMPIGEAFGLNRLLPRVWGTLDVMLFLTAPLIPLSFAYAIIRHRVIPVSLIIRRSVRYLLVSKGSTLLMLGTVAIVVTVVLDGIFRRFRPPGMVIGLVSAAVGIATWVFSGAVHNRYVAPVIDRRFFRQSYDARKIVTDLAQFLRTTTTLPQICEEVAVNLQSALQTENVHVFLEEDADYPLRFACRYDVMRAGPAVIEGDGRLPKDWDLIRRLAETGEPVEVNPDRGQESGLDLDAELTALEREFLRGINSAYLLPLNSKSGLEGVVSLGPRLGDLPFTGEDKQLLMSVAGPTALAIENAKLVGRMIEEARRRQELEAENEQRQRELEEARQLQLSMLPAELPRLPDLEVKAFMRTATEVGGDYYDFHLGPDGTLTVAIGDATGHGLKAGTVVTAVKSLFNHLAADPDIVGILRQSSIALKRMNLRSMFMAMTLVRYRDGRATLGAAGMPHALIYSAATRQVREAAINGLPLGALTSFPYRQIEFQLERGDVLLLLSDGLPERFNADGEMLDYERVRKAFAGLAAGTPGEIIDGLVRLGDEWARGRPLDDDMTFVVLKVQSGNYSSSSGSRES